MKCNRIFLQLLLLTVPLTLSGQESDFGLWYEVNAEKSFSKKFEVSAEAMIRTFNNASQIEQGFMEIGASYRIAKFLGFTGSYRIGNIIEDDNQYHIRHKWLADLKGFYSPGNFDLSLRLRLQIRSRIYDEDPSDTKAEYDGRLKLKGAYNIQDFPVDPYVSFETFTPVFRSSERLIR